MGDQWKDEPVEEVLPGKGVLQFAIAEGYRITDPFRGTEHSAGLDVFVPELSYQFASDYWSKNHVAFRSEEDRKEYYEKLATSSGGLGFNITIRAHDRVIIPTGLRFNIPEGTYLEVANRGSMAAKEGLVYGAHIIDSDYNGNVFINQINTTNDSVTLVCGQKFAQLIHKEYIKSLLIKIPESNIRATARGDGALGSTGK